MSNELKILYWNCQGLGQKRAELHQLVTDLKIDVLLLNETHLNSKKKFSLPNFSTYRTDRRNSGSTNCGGTAVLIRRNIAHSRTSTPTTSLENTSILTHFNGKDLRLTAIYKSPSSILNTADLDNLLDSDANTILAGDFNAKCPIWHSSCTNRAGNTLLNHMELNNYTIVAPDTPTFFPDIHQHNPDVLDIALLKTQNLRYELQNLNELSSDHNPILLTISSASHGNAPPNNKFLTNWKRFAVHLHESITDPNPSIVSVSELDNAVENLTTTFQETVTRNTTVIPANSSKGLPRELQNSLKLKRRLRKLWQHTRDPDVKTMFNRQSKLVRDSLQTHSNSEWTNTLENLKPNDPKIFRINRSLINKKSAERPLHGPSGLSYDNEAKATIFASTLEDQFTCPPGSDAIEEHVAQNLLFLDQHHPHSLTPISPIEVWNIIKKLPRRKAPGPDQISNTALRHSSKRVVLHITKILNSCLRLEHFPSKWKLATVVMIPKPKADLTYPANHRPISLLNSLSKLFEITLLSRLKKAASHLIRPEQFAFRPEHSTSIQLTKLIDDLSISFNRKERTAAIFLDFAKAFDKVWHDGLLSKLIDMHIPTQLVLLIRSFLNNRKFQVKVKNSISAPRNIAAGVPQGSCLSPLLFTLYINDMPSNPLTKTNLFADDTMFFHTSMSKHHAARKLQEHVNRASDWLTEWKITINPKKSVAVLFGDKKPTDVLPIHLNGHSIPWQTSVRYLGVSLDSRLTLAKHAKLTYNKARGIRAALYPMLGKSSPIPIRVKLNIVKMYINTILTYAGPAWGALICDSAWEKLEAVHNIALRTITNTPWYVRNDVLRRSLGVKSIRESVIAASHAQFHKTTKSKFIHLTDLALINATVDWKRRRPARLLE